MSGRSSGEGLASAFFFCQESSSYGKKPSGQDVRGRKSQTRKGEKEWKKKWKKK
jgi:hypothetical protein